jgi:pilus assembly protein FimV
MSNFAFEFSNTATVKRCGILSWAVTAKLLSVVLLSGGILTEAQALTVGRTALRSIAGQPLAAELEISDISANESVGLNVRIAPPEVYASAGLERGVIADQIQLKLEKTASGQTIVSLKSANVVDAAKIDLVLEFTWATGRVVREAALTLAPSASGRPPAADLPALARAPSNPELSGVQAGAAAVTFSTSASRDGRPQIEKSDAKTVVASNFAVKSSQQSAPTTVGPSNQIEYGANGVPVSIVARSKNFETYRHLMAQGVTRARADPRVQALGSEAKSATVTQNEGAVKTVVVQKERDATLTKPAAAAPLDRLEVSNASSGGRLAKVESQMQERQAQDVAARQTVLAKNMQELTAMSQSAAIPSQAKSGTDSSSAAPAASTAELKNLTPSKSQIEPPSATLSQRMMANPYILPLLALLLLTLFGVYYFNPNREKVRDEWFLTVQK